jgi:hypothetical protein
MDVDYNTYRESRKISCDKIRKNPEKRFGLAGIKSIHPSGRSLV